MSHISIPLCVPHPPPQISVMGVFDGSVITCTEYLSVMFGFSQEELKHGTIKIIDCVDKSELQSHVKVGYLITISACVWIPLAPFLVEGNLHDHVQHHDDHHQYHFLWLLCITVFISIIIVTTMIRNSP